MERKTFLKLINLGGVGLLLSPGLACSCSNSPVKERFIFEISNKNEAEPPKGTRVPFGWDATGIEPGKSVLLKSESKLPEKNCHLRISIAQEIRDEKLVHVRIPGTNQHLGAIDIRFSSVLVPYELEIDKKYVSDINKFGLELTLEAPTPLWIFNSKNYSGNNDILLPHILVSDKTVGNTDDFLNSFLTAGSIQSFGWREGSVLDGLWQLYHKKGSGKALQVIKEHFDLFFDESQNLVYEDGRSRPKMNDIHGIESTIPFATLARLNPDHPILKKVVEGWRELEKEDGAVIDGTTISAEGCYTVAYPMAVIGKAWNDETLQKMALAQLKHRFVLIENNTLNLRYLRGQDKYTFPNWARGAAWTLLGFSRTIAELQDTIQDEEVNNKFREGVEIALSMQREDGLWNCFMHDKKGLPDTSGSAGIAAAILTGVEIGILPEVYRENAQKCWAGLQNYLAPDGLLRGVAQDNRGGVELLAGNYRVIAQMGMGLMAQLYAAL